MDVHADIQYLKGVGPARAKAYHKLGIHTLYDLVYHFPRDYLDLSTVTPIADASQGEPHVFRAQVIKKKPEIRVRKGLFLFKCTIADESGALGVTFFNAKYAFESLREGETYLFYGSLSGGPRPELGTPMIFGALDTPAFLPVYPLTAGLSSKVLSRSVRLALDSAGDALSDPIPPEIREQHCLCELQYALENIHFPTDQHAAQIARDRLIFEELFILSLSLRLIRCQSKPQTAVQIKPYSPQAFYDSLPFPPTAAQRRAVSEILSALRSTTPMNRLLQGDVGSGKTLVAAAACLAVIKSGYQCAVMAPTEILASQHLETFQTFLSPFGISCALLTGSRTAKEKRAIQQQIEQGEIQVILGTHALLSGGVQFCKLGLCVTDEQHRFGVAQRTALQSKSENPHVLVMSATPIPRTLALIIYGDLELSVLDELPSGRTPVETMCISSKKLPRAYGFIQQHLDAGRQAYVVCPLVEESEDSTPGLASAQTVAETLADGPFKAYRVGLMHGKMSAAQKDETMRRFKAGEIQLLVCTTIIEVGVDVPNASVLLCMNAERFGLSQLHQLRGRVGRGAEAAYCILVSDARGDTARERLSAMCETTDGFRISETDLKLRGPGDFFGQRQHGLPAMRIAQLAQDMDVLSRAQQSALRLLEEDAALAHPRHKALRERCDTLIESVGGQPN